LTITFARDAFLNALDVGVGACAARIRGYRAQRTGIADGTNPTRGPVRRHSRRYGASRAVITRLVLASVN
jgi:hypothetical protein